MAAKTEVQETAEMTKLTRALQEHAEKNSEIADALELMKQAQTVRNLPLRVLDRFAYTPTE